MVAIKVIDLEKCPKKDKEHARNEKKYLKELSHPCLVKYIDAFDKVVV